MDKKLQNPEKNYRFSETFEKNFQDCSYQGVLAEELEACNNLYNTQEEYTPTMALIYLFFALKL